jgi:hypothetical protein
MHRTGSIAAALAALVLSGSAVAQTRQPAPQARPAQPAPQPPRAAAPQQVQVPPVATLIVLIKSSLIALDQANKTGNYAVLHALGSDTMRRTASPQTLAQSFAGFRQNRIDLNPVIVVNPQLARNPAIEQGRLHIVGFFPTQPLRINFDFWFEPSQGQWKAVQLNASLAPAPAQSQQAPQQRPQQPQQSRPQPQRR